MPVVIGGGGGGGPKFSEVTTGGGWTGLDGGGPAAGVKDVVLNISVRFIPTISVEFFVTSPTRAHAISNFLYLLTDIFL